MVLTIFFFFAKIIYDIFKNLKLALKKGKKPAYVSTSAKATADKENYGGRRRESKMTGRSALMILCIFFVFGAMGADGCEPPPPPDYDYDYDYDGWYDYEDNCIQEYNPYQWDLDGDGWGDVCDCDIDGDWYDGYQCYGWDCDDYNFYVNPGVADWCDGWDSNCDGWDC